MTETGVWLAKDAYERLRMELAELLRQRSGSLIAATPPEISSSARDSSDQNTDQQIMARRRDREQRIRKLQEMLQNAVVGHEPPDDGIAEPGMVVTVRFADDPDTEELLLAHREEDAYPDLEICSPGSPLGRALCGAREGQQRHYRLPGGDIMSVRLIRAVPYRD
jgi:transcription elongation factor GreA